MKLHEYQSKDLLAKFGVPVPGGDVTSDPAEAKAIADKLGGKVVVKAQVLMGGRGKAGGVKLFDNSEDAAAFTKELIGKKLVSIQNPDGMVVEKVLVGELVDIAEEYYLAVLLDRAEQKNLVMISARGGMDIEEVAHNEPEAIVRLHVDPAWGLSDFQVRKAVKDANIPKVAQNQMVSMIKKLVKAFQETDADLVEINPVALTPDGKLIAADAKVAIDDNALFRYPDYNESKDDAAEDPIEAEAARRGIAYVRLGGDIGIMGNGAGLVMCSLDEVSAAGGKAADFLDVGGGAQQERVKSCVELVLMDKEVKGLLINIFGGITRCDEVARGILQALSEVPSELPMVVRLNGTNAEEGRAIIQNANIPNLYYADTLTEAAQKAVAAAKGEL